LRIKYAATSILQHVGGIHSGCALSGAAYVHFSVLDIGKWLIAASDGSFTKSSTSFGIALYSIRLSLSAV
jgi:hypothetical protein